jgi:hypothetical protein
MIEIFVRGISAGRTETYECKADGTVQDLQQSIWNKLRACFHMYSLKCGDRTLDGHQSLAHYGIVQESTVHVSWIDNCDYCRGAKSFGEVLGHDADWQKQKQLEHKVMMAKLDLHIAERDLAALKGTRPASP